MSLKHNKTYTVDDQSPVSDYYSPPDSGGPRSSEDLSSKNLSNQHLNDTFTVNAGDHSIHNQSCNSTYNSQKSCDTSQSQICPTQNSVDLCSRRVETDLSPLDKSSTIFNPNQAFTSLSSYFRTHQSQNPTDSVVEKCQSCQEPNAYALHTCEAVYSESHQLLSTYTIGTSASTSGQSNQLLSTYTIDSHAYTDTMDLSGIEIFQNCSNHQSSQSGEKVTNESEVFLSDQSPNASRTKPSDLLSNRQSTNSVPSAPSSCKSCSDQFKLREKNQFSKEFCEDVNEKDETSHTQSCVKKNKTREYQCCENSKKSAIDFCSDNNNRNFSCDNTGVQIIASKTFCVDKSDWREKESQLPCQSSEFFRVKSDFNSDTEAVIDPTTVPGCTSGANSQDVDDIHCSGTSKYDAISARLSELFTKGTSAAGKCSCCPVIPSNSAKLALDSKLDSPKQGSECDKSNEDPKSSCPAIPSNLSKAAVDSKPVSPKPGDECDKSNDDPKSSSTHCSEKSPLSKDLFSSAEFLAELENERKKRFSPGLTQDSLFAIISQGKAYHHFKAQLEKQGNVQSSTQENFKERVTADHGSSSETQFSPLCNKVDEQKSPHFRTDSEVPAKIETSSSSSKPALSLSEQKSDSTVGTLPASERDSLIVNLPESLVPVSEAGPQFTPEVSNQSATSVHSANIAPIADEETSLSTLKSKPTRGFTSPSSSLCTVVELELESAKKQNRYVINQDVSEATCSEKETAVSALNTAYIAEEAVGVEDANIRQKKILPRQNRMQAFRKFRKKKRFSQNSQRSSSVTASSGDTSKPSNQTSSSSKTRSSSTNTSSCIVESSIVNPIKEFKNKTNIRVSNYRKNSLPCRKRRQPFRRHKIVQPRKMKRKSEQATNSSLSTVYSSLNSNSGQAIEVTEARKIDRVPEFIDLAADPEQKLPQRKRRSLFKKFKILQRRRKQRQAEKNWRIKVKRKYASNVESTKQKLQHEPSHMSNKTSHSSSSSVSVIETSVPNDLVFRNNRTVRETPGGNKATLNESCAPSPKSRQEKLASQTSTPEYLPLNHDHTTKEGTFTIDNVKISNKSSTSSPRRSQRNLTMETSLSNDYPLSYDSKIKDRIVTVSNKTVLDESCPSSPRRSKRKLTPATSMSKDLPLSPNSAIKDTIVTFSNETVSNESCVSGRRRSQRNLTPETSASNDPSLTHDGTIKDRIVTVSNKTVLDESYSSSPRRSQRNLTPETSNDLPSKHNSSIKDSIVSKKSVLNESCGDLRRSQRKLTPETSTSSDLPRSCVVLIRKNLGTVSNKTVLNESCPSGLRRSQRKLTPETSMPNGLSLSQDDAIKNSITVPVSNKAVLNESFGSGLRRSQRILTPEISSSNEHSLSHEDKIRSTSYTTSKKTTSNESVLSSPRRSERKCTPVESSAIPPKQQIVRLGCLNYFCINVRVLSQEFLEFHGFLPKLCLQPVAVQGIKRKHVVSDCLQPVAVQGIKRKRVVSDCYVLLEDCMRGKNYSLSPETCSFNISPKRRKISSPSFETLSFFRNPKKRVSLSSSKKDSASGSEARASCQEAAKNLEKVPTVAASDPIPSTSKEEKKNCDLTEKEQSCSSSGVDKDSVKSAENGGLKSVPLESSMSVKACLMQISPRISENIVSAVCCHCNNLIPYGLAETKFVAFGGSWPNNMAPLCPSASCNRRKLYWGIFKTKLVLKTEEGEYLIAQTTTPDAEKFFGCSVEEFFEDAEHERRIKERIGQLLVPDKKPEDIIFKNYNLIVHQSKYTLRIRIVNTNLFDP